MRTMVIVVVLPFAQLLVEQVNVVGHSALIEELVELLGIDPVRALNFAFQVWRSRPDVDVADVQAFDMPMKLRLELRSVVLESIRSEMKRTDGMSWSHRSSSTPQRTRRWARTRQRTG